MNKLRKIYHALPYLVRNVIGGLYGSLPQKIKYGPEYAKMYKLLNESANWSQDEIHDYQIRQLRNLLIHAHETTRFYNRQFNEAGFNPYKFNNLDDLSLIPTIDKEVIRNNLSDMLSDKFSNRQRFQITTGGTTGRQLIFYAQKRLTIPREKAMYDYLWGEVGYIPGKSEMVVLRNNVLPDNKLWRYEKKNRSLVLDPFHMTDEVCHKFINKLNKEKIPFFHVYPSSILMLAEYMNRTGDRLTYKPLAIFATSENLYKGQREIIENAFGCRMYMSYGHSEMCSLANGCALEDHYHIEELYGYTELLDKSRDVINDSGIMGEITATGFNNYVLPLIRYRTADYASYEECVKTKCGFKGRILKDIEGRWLQEMLVTSQGNKISMTAINFHSDVFDRVKYYQFYQNTPGLVTMRIVKGKDYTIDDEVAIKRAVQSKLGEYLKMDIQYVNEVRRAASGKYRYIISELD